MGGRMREVSGGGQNADTIRPQQDPLLQISIDNALQTATTMPYNDFVSMVQRMEFKVINNRLTF